MSSRNIRLIQRAFEDYREGRIEALLSIAHPDLTVAFDAGLPRAGRRQGHDAVRELVEEWEDDWGGDAEPLAFVECDSSVIVPVRYRGRRLSEGAGDEDVFTHSFRLRGGLIVEWRVSRGAIAAPAPARLAA
jgi:ketosteroid isomerase-like protein